jgi:hypothetical protein
MIQLEDWLARFARSDETNQRDDVHVERIDEAYREKSQWVTGAFDVIRIAHEIQALRRWRITIAMEFFLSSQDHPTGMNIRTLDDLQAQLSWSPPALTA